MIYFMPICEADQMEAQYQNWLPHLPPARQEKLLRYRFVKNRWLCAAVYMLLLHGLQEEYGLTEDQIVIEIADSGKPYLSSHPHIYFNLSHCDGGVACGISNGPIGVDVESMRKIDNRVANRVFSVSEQEILAHSKNPTHTFIAMWTLKESWLKATEYGLSYALNQVNVNENPLGCYYIDKDGYTARALNVSLPVVGSVCSPASNELDCNIVTIFPSTINKGGTT